MTKKEFTITMKDNYTVAELANIWYQITTSYKLAKKAHEKANDNITLDIYTNAATNMAILYDYVTMKIEPDEILSKYIDPER